MQRLHIVNDADVQYFVDIHGNDVRCWEGIVYEIRTFFFHLHHDSYVVYNYMNNYTFVSMQSI